MFDTDREADALARFDELTAAPSAKRRVRPNAATAFGAALDAAIAARDLDAVQAVLVDPSELVDHTTGVTWDLEGSVASFRALLHADEPSLHHEPIATLGDSLALLQQTSSASGFTGRRFEVGPYLTEHMYMVEADAQGRSLRGEFFAADRLGDALVRLYERYAALLPEGPERARAAGAARSISAWVGPARFERIAATVAPDIEAVDHRILGTWSSRGAEATTANFRSMFDLTDDVIFSVNDILALRADMLLVRRMQAGKDRASGGAYERQSLGLVVFGDDGLFTRFEWFDTDREEEALARFDELAATAP
jgi:hypothetical protein